jgi:16S rRNA (cytosine1402-N4)-methyltransferase
MASEVLYLLDPQPGQVVVDATIGYAGHALPILRRILPGGLLIGIDRDGEALRWTATILRDFSGSFRLIHGNFRDLDPLLQKEGVGEIHGILFDLGVSSPQLDQPARGFSYQWSAPLDMRMDPEQELDASKVVNTYEERELARIIREFGEERWASRIAKFIVETRKRAAITTTDRLVEIIEDAIPASARRRGGHPARRTFQALRMEVNREIPNLEEALPQAIARLGGGGRIAVISYHSLEDRVVKRTFKEYAARCSCSPSSPLCDCGAGISLRIITRKPLVPGEDEVRENPRARSAKLRGAERRVVSKGAGSR